jgi:hypothetical protein
VLSTPTGKLFGETAQRAGDVMSHSKTITKVNGHDEAAAIRQATAFVFGGGHMEVPDGTRKT